MTDAAPGRGGVSLGLRLTVGFAAVEDAKDPHSSVFVVQFQNCSPITNPETMFSSPTSQPYHIALARLSKPPYRGIHTLSHSPVKSSEIVQGST